MPPELGALVAGRYRVLEPLGKGGMGEVFSAENTRTGRKVAIKLLRAEAKSKQSAIERFRREARAAGSINSEFVTEVLDVEDDDEHGIVLVFELLEGESLVERLKRTGPIPFLELWGIVEAVLIGLADAHAAGIVHRDLKPSNVYLEQRRNRAWVKILDFGISKLPKQASVETLTQVGQSLGTFSFMPPEQIGKAKSVDHRADIYACATLVYQALSGKLPYKARNVVHMMELKRKQEPRSLGEVMRTPVTPEMEDFIAKGLARSPNDRFQTATETLSAWRALRPAGAKSIYTTDASHHYQEKKEAVDLAPISGEVATLQLEKSPLMTPEAQRILEAAKRRPGIGKTQVIPESMRPIPPPELRDADLQPHGGQTHGGQTHGGQTPSGQPQPYSAPPYSGQAGAAVSGHQPYSGQPYSGQPHSGGQAHPSQPHPSQPFSEPLVVHHPLPASVTSPPLTSANRVGHTTGGTQPLENAVATVTHQRSLDGGLLPTDDVTVYDDDNDGPSTLALVLGGLLLVAVGFVAVAFALRYFG